MFGFSSIYVIFEDKIDFYWSRSRILEKLNSLPPNLLPDGVQPSLGPDATALGQIFWYTLEGRDPDGNATGGWDLHELRSIQDFYVRYGLSSAEGVAEVASWPYPDPEALNPESKYFDPKSSPDDPRWYLVDIRLVNRLDEGISLREIKEHAVELGDFPHAV